MSRSLGRPDGPARNSGRTAEKRDCVRYRACGTARVVEVAAAQKELWVPSRIPSQCFAACLTSAAANY